MTVSLLPLAICFIYFFMLPRAAVVTNCGPKAAGDTARPPRVRRGRQQTLIPSNSFPPPKQKQKRERERGGEKSEMEGAKPKRGRRPGTANKKRGPVPKRKIKKKQFCFCLVNQNRPHQNCLAHPYHLPGSTVASLLFGLLSPSQ